MTIIIRQNLTISDFANYAEELQIAAGITVTIRAGATLNLNGNKLTNYGTLILEGNENLLATIKNTNYSTESTSGQLKTNYGNIEQTRIDGFFSNGTLLITNSVIKNSSVDALEKNTISSSLFIDSDFDLGIESTTVSKTTFLRSQVSADAWNSSGGSSSFTDTNFIGTKSKSNKNKTFRVGYRDWETDRKSTRLNSSHSAKSRMPSSA